MDGEHLLPEAVNHKASAIQQLNPEASGNVDVFLKLQWTGNTSSQTGLNWFLLCRLTWNIRSNHPHCCLRLKVRLLQLVVPP